MHATHLTGGSFRYAGQYATVPAGYTYVRASVRVRNLAGATFMRARLGYRDDPATGTVTYGALTTGVAAPGWTTITVEGVVPSTTQYVNVITYPVDGPSSTNTPVDTEWGMDALCIELGTTADDTGPADYFDGDTYEGDGTFTARWTGTPNASTSQLTRGGTE